MSERVPISRTEQITPYLRPVTQKYAYNELTRRQSEEDIDWFVGNPNSLASHRLGYERDELTPSHQAVITTHRLSGTEQTLPVGTLVAYRSIIVPADLSEEGIAAFVHGRYAGASMPHRQYADILVNQARGIRRRTSVEQAFMMDTDEMGLNLAARALHQCLDGVYADECVDESDISDIQEAYQTARSRLQLVHLADASRLKDAIRYNY